MDAPLRFVGRVHSPLTELAEAPRQGSEGAPDAWVEILEELRPALLGISEGDSIVVITWLDLADRTELRTHPRNDPSAPLAGVFATRSPNRPNPLGLHPVTVRAIEGSRLLVGPLEALDGTPVVDIKPVLRGV